MSRTDGHTGAAALERLLQGGATAGQQVVELAPSSMPSTVVAAKAAGMGWDVMVIDGRQAVDKASALRAFTDGCGFPDWFGNNLDALADALSDLSWRPEGPHLVIWNHAGVLAAGDPAAAATFRSILAETGPEGRFGAVLL